VRSLPARGADPEASFEHEYGSMRALYGAAGVVHSAEITRILLEAGASPDDGESVHHSVEAADPACLALLLEHGGNPSDGLGRALDFDPARRPARRLPRDVRDAARLVLPRLLGVDGARPRLRGGGARAAGGGRGLRAALRRRGGRAAGRR
jgi:hypothetical protein